MLFAFVNIGFTLFFALICVRRIYLPSLFQKFIGVVSIAIYGCFAIALNLFLAHYREVSGSTFEEAGRAALTQALNNPVGLHDIESWLLFASGLLFSLIAFIDGWSLTDPYPGLAKTYKQMLNARSEYTQRQAELIDDLTNVRDDHENSIKEIIESLNERRAQHNEITAHRTKMLSLFATYQDNLERTANTLLKTYREANRKARKTPVPAYYAHSYQLVRVKPTFDASVELTSQEIAKAIRKTQTELSAQIKEITQLCSDGIDQYHELDKLYPDEAHG
jgi:DNA-binding transcriptional MerR regulator